MCNNITSTKKWNGQGMENADVDISVMMIVLLSSSGIYGVSGISMDSIFQDPATHCHKSGVIL